MDGASFQPWRFYLDMSTEIELCLTGTRVTKLLPTQYTDSWSTSPSAIPEMSIILEGKSLDHPFWSLGGDSQGWNHQPTDPKANALPPKAPWPVLLWKKVKWMIWWKEKQHGFPASTNTNKFNMPLPKKLILGTFALIFYMQTCTIFRPKVLLYN